MYHYLWENNPQLLPNVPGGADWLARIVSERPDEAERHLSVHYSHCTHLSEADRIGLAAFGENIPWNGWVGSAEELRKRAEAIGVRGDHRAALYTGWRRPDRRGGALLRGDEAAPGLVD